jgi:hypothetical protein
VGRILGLLSVVLPGSSLHRLSYEPPTAEEGNPRAVGSSEDQHVWVQGCVVSGGEGQVWLCVLAWWAHSLKIATRGLLALPQVGDLFLRHVSYKQGLCPGPIDQARRRRAAYSESRTLMEVPGRG